MLLLLMIEPILRTIKKAVTQVSLSASKSALKVSFFGEHTELTALGEALRRGQI